MSCKCNSEKSVKTTEKSCSSAPKENASSAKKHK